MLVTCEIGVEMKNCSTDLSYVALFNEGISPVKLI